MGKTVLARTLAVSLGAELSPGPGPPRPAADRRHRRLGVLPGLRQLGVPAGPGLRPRGPARRAQPDPAAHPVGPARGDGGAAGDAWTARRWPLPRPHLVLATQNPIGQLGTYPLVESQLDRFALSTPLGYPDAADRDPAGAAPRGAGRPWPTSSRCARWTPGPGPSGPPGPCTWPHRSPSTRWPWPGPPARRRPVRLGASPRASITLVRSAQAHALLYGRDVRVAGRRPGDGRGQPGPPPGDRRGLGGRCRRW